MEDVRKIIFQKALKEVDLELISTLGAWVVEADKENNPEYGKLVGRKPSLCEMFGERSFGECADALDLFCLLNFGQSKNTLLICRYCGPNLLDEYPGIIKEALSLGLEIDGDKWVWPRPLAQSISRTVWAFWNKVSSQRMMRGLRKRYGL